MPEGVATSIIVFGRGLIADRSGFQLSRASEARVKALVDYIEKNKSAFSSQRGRVVFSGGWGGAIPNMLPPPEAYREGALMAKHAQALSVDGADLAFYADSAAEIDSDSTLENVLRTKEAGYFREISFTAANPLGIVAHSGHQKRIRYFIQKIYGLRGDAVLHITPDDGDDPSDGQPETIALLLTRLAFAGAASHSSLRHRQRLMLAAGHALAAGIGRAIDVARLRDRLADWPRALSGLIICYEMTEATAQKGATSCQRNRTSRTRAR